jgi:N-methylhydantoinase A/oxoprolinase/acetone carboxylase beta subunit
MASTLSAFGMLAADVVKDYSQTVMLQREVAYQTLLGIFEPLVARAFDEMKSEGYSKQELAMEYALDLRYVGQSYELTIPLTVDYQQEFHRQHQIAYGYQRLDIPLEIVNIKLRAIGSNIPPAPTPLADSGVKASDMDVVLFNRTVHFREGARGVPFYHGDELQPGYEINGPAILVCRDTTVLVVDGFWVYVDGSGNFMMVNGYAKLFQRLESGI